MVFNATFNNISAISWQSVLLVGEIEEPGENQWPVPSHWQTLSQNVVSSTPRLNGVRTHNISGVIGAELIQSCVRGGVKPRNIGSQSPFFDN
jgi:hypothetical protein